ncbi:hypothetical protein CA235_18410 [Sphingomonas sp. ABOLF]|uniref:hypothetical protein n=1 Tax=Sphingomonas sp. ABOLF TaxID=1985879 RepID=UPI000F7FA439|nr:hypothetical protein [Sphingomonas sp. ABOLF]RSV11644.1 hypothetical protein CA235_18410 [Sphingomonas sp. ABOLF]
MVLESWLEREGVDVRVFAQRIGRSPEAVRRYITGDRIPDKGTMPLIVEQTRGEVTPNDFFGISVSSAQVAA